MSVGYLFEVPGFQLTNAINEHGIENKNEIEKLKWKFEMKIFYNKRIERKILQEAYFHNLSLLDW